MSAVDRAEIESAVRAWAKGLYPSEAGVELLIRQGKAIYARAPWIAQHGDYAVIDVNKLVYEAGAWSGSERRVVAIAASLLSSEHPVNLEDAVSGLDRVNLQLVLAAIAHANGSHEHSALRRGPDGATVGFEQLSSAFAWPQDASTSGPARRRSPAPAEEDAGRSTPAPGI